MSTPHYTQQRALPARLLVHVQGVAGEVRRIRSLAATVAALQQLLSGLRARCGWRPHRVHLLGFSQVSAACLGVSSVSARTGLFAAGERQHQKQHCLHSH